MIFQPKHALNQIFESVSDFFAKINIKKDRPQ